MKTLTRTQIINRLKIDDSGMIGYIGEFKGSKSDNNNLGGLVTLNMISKLEVEGVLTYIGSDNIWVDLESYNKL